MNVTLPLGSNAPFVSLTVAESCIVVPSATELPSATVSCAALCSVVAVAVSALLTVKGSQALVDALKLSSPG